VLALVVDIRDARQPEHVQVAKQRPSADPDLPGQIFGQEGFPCLEEGDQLQQTMDAAGFHGLYKLVEPFNCIKRKAAMAAQMTAAMAYARGPGLTAASE
jgi:hypothetical protein